MSLVIALVLLILPVLTPASPLINEIRTDQLASDLDEYFELAGDPGESLTGYAYLVIGDDPEAGGGFLEAVIDLSGLSIAADGVLSVGEDASIPCGEIDVALPGALDFEDSDNVTHMLVSGFVGAVDTDLDTDDDGVLELEPWTAVIDAVALIETTLSGDPVYCDAILGPDQGAAVTHAVRCAAGWGIGEFALCGLDTPGAPNDAACAVPTERSSWGAVKAAYR